MRIKTDNVPSSLSVFSLRGPRAVRSDGAASWKAAPRLVVFAVALALQLAVTVITIDLLSAIRAYVNGESLYSKGQKDSYIHLLAYIESRRTEDHQAFQASIGIPIADRIAREELSSPSPEAARASRALLDGGTHPSDVQSVIRLFRLFEHTPLMSRAIEIWIEGDRAVEELRVIGERVRTALLAPNPDSATVAAMQAAAKRINDQLTSLETEFSHELGRSARASERFLMAVNLALAVVLWLIGAAFLRRQEWMETDYRQRREAMVLSRAAFLSKVSHELRSPLQSMVSSLDVFEMRHVDAARGDAELISRMRRASLLLNTQLRDLLTLAKGEAGRLEVRPEAFEAAELVQAMGDAARPLADARGLALVVQVPEAPIFVVADGSRIDQILTNLVVNSVRYTDAGTVNVVLHPFDPALRRLRFTVADTGRGIPESELPTLFQPERQGATTARRGEGSGIGLAIVRILVDQLGGAISVSSRVAEGTTFDVEIPAELPAAEAGPEAADAAPDTAPMPLDGGALPPTRVLVVDDREDVLDAVAGVIDEIGYRCDRASSAGEAANLIASRRYALALLDLDMPGRGGAELAAAIRAGGGPNASIRLVAMTAGDPPQASDRDPAPFDAWLAKPVDSHALRRAVLGAERESRPSQPGLFVDTVVPTAAARRAARGPDSARG